jgi:radical SAM protein with 4Fe4S-binding SPASM domain
MSFASYLTYYRFDSATTTPQTVFLEITGACNLRCPACPRTYSANTRGNMKNALYTHCLQSIKEGFPALEELAFHGFGEIELKKDFPQLVHEARALLPTTKLTVSTTLSVDRTNIIDKLLSACFDSIGIWPDGYSAESYARIRTGGSYGVLKKNLRYMLEQREILGLERTAVHVGMVRNRINFSHVEEFISEFSFVEEYVNTSLTTVDGHDWAGQVPSRDILVSAKKANFKLPRPCFVPFTLMMIAANGKVSMCCQDMDLTMQIGDLAAGDSIRQAWESDAANAIRRSMLSLRPKGICKTCDRAYFGYWNIGRAANLLGLRKQQALPHISEIRPSRKD